MSKNNISPWNLFRDSCQKYPYNTMVVHGDKGLTYLQMYDRVQKFSGLIEKINFRIGGVYLPNSAEFISSMLALNKQGKIFVPFSYQLKGQTLLERLSYADVELIITDEKGLSELAAIRQNLDIRAMIVLWGTGNFEVYEFPSYSEKEKDIGNNIFGMFLIPRTSSKCLGVMVSNSSIVINSLHNAEIMGMTSTDRLLSTRSFSIADPIVGDILSPISCGSSIIILNDLFHPSIILRTIQEYKVTSVLMVGTMLAMILEYRNLGNFDIKSLKRIEFASITTPQWIIKDMIEKLQGIDLYCIYGVPEAPTRASYLGPSEIHKFPGSVGRPVKGYDIKIYTKDGIEAKCGEEGLIYLDGNCLMEGYYKNNKLTSCVLTPNGLRTNDIGYKNEDGRLYLTGRVDDMIMQGGYEVYPTEIKDVLLQSKYIEDASVFGVDDKKLGRKTVALISAKSSSDIQVQDVIKLCKANLEEKKIPKEVYIVDKDLIYSIEKMDKKKREAFYYDSIHVRR